MQYVLYAEDILGCAGVSIGLRLCTITTPLNVFVRLAAQSPNVLNL
jgi:hypothetical protein